MSIEIPYKLLKKIDTSNHDFERNRRYLYSSEISSEDSLSFLYITVEDFNDILITTNEVKSNLKRMINEQKFLINSNNPSLFEEKYDTLKGNVSGDFIMNGKMKNNLVLAGGRIFYHNKKRVEVVVLLKQNDFNDPKQTIKCILASIDPDVRTLLKK